LAHNSDMTQGKPPGSSNFAVPSSTGGDLVYAALKGGLSAVPLVGGNLAEFMQVFFASPIEKRREEWMKQVAHALTHLMAKGLTVESIQSNERFNSAVFQANAIAQRTHRKEKLDALRNALINIALTQTPDETIESIFLGYIDSFTEWHIRILRFYEAPSARSRLTEINQVLEQTFPALKNRPDIYETIWTDLYQKGLVDMQSLHGPIDSSIKNKHATELGKKFLNFIADPVRDTV
jgi:hypothetical protein